MIGHGLDRGGPVSWDGHAGFILLGTQSIRWGTNEVDGAGMLDNSAAFATVFDRDGARAHEAQGAYGDSGGAVFAKNAQGDWELAGIMFAIDIYEDQPYYYVLDGNVTYAVDLASYRDQIIATVRPECSDEVENDGDGLVDFPDDPGCKSAEDLSEAADCDDGIDNDGDGLVDYGGDPGCRNRRTGRPRIRPATTAWTTTATGSSTLADPQCAASPAWWTSEAVAYSPELRPRLRARPGDSAARGAPSAARSRELRRCASEHANVRGFRTLAALSHFELHLLSVLERAKALRDDVRVMDEDVLPSPSGVMNPYPF